MAADVRGTYNTKVNSPTPENIVDAIAVGGNVKMHYDEYEAASLASGQKIAVGGNLPVGARMVGGYIVHDALKTGVTLKCGDAGDDNRYLVAAAAATAGTLELRAIAGMGYEITGTDDTEVLIEVGGAAATGTIKIVQFYVPQCS